MSRSKRKKRTRLCACGVRIETSDRGAHDMCYDKRQELDRNLRARIEKQIQEEQEEKLEEMARMEAFRRRISF